MAYGHWIVPSHLARGSAFQWDELREASFVDFPAGVREHDLQLSGLTHAGLSPSCLLSASTVDAILGFVQAGLGYSLAFSPSKEGPRLAGVVSEQRGTGARASGGNAGTVR
jgi:DNA-binding transcriptional LysR family regulator